MKKSVYLDDKKYIEIEPNAMLVNDMRERGIIPDTVPDEEICMVIWGAGSWQMSWRNGNKSFVYNPWTALITEKGMY